MPVVGADRLSLPGQYSREGSGSTRALVQPQDDLSLAAVLRSPIFDLPEQRPFDLSRRGGAQRLADPVAAPSGRDEAASPSQKP